MFISRVRATVAKIVWSQRPVDPQPDFGRYASAMADMIIALDDNDAPELKCLSVRRRAMRLTASAMVELEYAYADTIEAGGDDSEAAEILTAIEWLRECLVDFGQQHGEQPFSATCLARHDQVLQTLLSSAHNGNSRSHAPPMNAAAQS